MQNLFINCCKINFKKLSFKRKISEWIRNVIFSHFKFPSIYIFVPENFFGYVEKTYMKIPCNFWLNCFKLFFINMYVYFFEKKINKRWWKLELGTNLGPTHCKGRVEVENKSYRILKKTFLLSKIVKPLDNIKTKLLHSFKLCHLKKN